MPGGCCCNQTPCDTPPTCCDAGGGGFTGTHARIAGYQPLVFSICFTTLPELPSCVSAGDYWFSFSWADQEFYDNPINCANISSDGLHFNGGPMLLVNAYDDDACTNNVDSDNNNANLYVDVDATAHTVTIRLDASYVSLGVSSIPIWSSDPIPFSKFDPTATYTDEDDNVIKSPIAFFKGTGAAGQIRLCGRTDCCQSNFNTCCFSPRSVASIEWTATYTFPSTADDPSPPTSPDTGFTVGHTITLSGSWSGVAVDLCDRFLVSDTDLRAEIVVTVDGVTVDNADLNSPEVSSLYELTDSGLWNSGNQIIVPNSYISWLGIGSVQFGIGGNGSGPFDGDTEAPKVFKFSGNCNGYSYSEDVYRFTYFQDSFGGTLRRCSTHEVSSFSMVITENDCCEDPDGDCVFSNGNCSDMGGDMGGAAAPAASKQMAKVGARKCPGCSRAKKKPA